MSTERRRVACLITKGRRKEFNNLYKNPVNEQAIPAVIVENFLSISYEYHLAYANTILARCINETVAALPSLPMQA